MTLVRVAALDELWSGELMRCEAGGVRIVLAHTGDAIYAYEDRCPHLGFPLSSGELAGGRLTCGAHHWQYDVRNGRGINPPSACLRAVPVVVRADGIYVDPEGMAPLPRAVDGATPAKDEPAGDCAPERLPDYVPSGRP